MIVVPQVVMPIACASPKEFFAEEKMVDVNPPEILELSAQDYELKRFFGQVRSAGRIVVRDGDDEFVVERRRVTITDEARRRLTQGGE